MKDPRGRCVRLKNLMQALSSFNPKTRVLAKAEKAKLLLISNQNGEGFRQRAQQEKTTYQNEQREERLPSVVENKDKLQNPFQGEQGAFL